MHSRSSSTAAAVYFGADTRRVARVEALQHDALLPESRAGVEQIFGVVEREIVERCTTPARHSSISSARRRSRYGNWALSNPSSHNTRRFYDGPMSANYLRLIRTLRAVAPSRGGPGS